MYFPSSNEQFVRFFFFKLMISVERKCIQNSKLATVIVVKCGRNILNQLVLIELGGRKEF